MSSFDLHAMDDAWFSEATSKTPSLTAAILGKIAICALRVYGQKGSGAFSSDDLESLFLSSREHLPAAINSLLHLDYGPGKTSLLEKTELTLGAQHAGIAARLNPENKRLHTNWDRTESFLQLEQYAVSFPEEVEWVKHAVKQQSERRSQG